MPAMSVIRTRLCPDNLRPHGGARLPADPELPARRDARTLLVRLRGLGRWSGSWRIAGPTLGHDLGHPRARHLAVLGDLLLGPPRRAGGGRRSGSPSTAASTSPTGARSWRSIPVIIRQKNRHLPSPRRRSRSARIAGAATANPKASDPAILAGGRVPPPPRRAQGGVPGDRRGTAGRHRRDGEVLCRQRELRARAPPHRRGQAPRDRDGALHRRAGGGRRRRSPSTARWRSST
jgi:hypothetical protein